ncbi:bifunctional diguanylate cyclase/phosphodiesterase [Leeia oryzae]|uniref:bifunctional diguanylate cyclase/phosphodiesterase n=1 Tax=Leeia oryzae TaxID=356662 RepID=UPI000377F858|nr:EAL domain-containing protein [Leeia oryzae]
MLTKTRQVVDSISQYTWGKLHARILRLIGITLLLTVTTGALVSWWILDYRFKALETQQIMGQLSAADALVQDRISGLSRAAADYALWDDSWNYMTAENPTYDTSTFTPEVLKNLDIDLFMMIRMDKSVRVAVGTPTFFLWSDKPVTISKTFHHLTTRMLGKINWQDIQMQLDQKKHAGQWLTVEHQQMLVGISPIMHSDGKGPQRGYLLMLKVITPARLAAMQKLTNSPFRIVPVSSVQTSGVRFGEDTFNAVMSTAIARNSGYALTYAGERPSNKERWIAFFLLLANVILIFAVATVVIMTGLSRLVVKRLQHYCVQLGRYESEGRSMRLQHEEVDEVDSLGHHVNDLLAKVEDHHQQLSYDATHDHLTLLENRILLQQRIEAVCNRAETSVAGIALILIDLDFFKNINDIHGHPAGDDLLKELAQRLLALSGKSHAVSRLGGDEFAIFMPHVYRQEDAMLLAEEIKLHLQNGVMVDQISYRMTASIGVVFIEGAHVAENSAAILLKKADIAMYRAKQHGRNTVILFADWMQALLEENNRLELELIEAIQQRAIDFYLQPIVDIAHHCLSSVEVLARWPHPRLGMVMPGTFIPIAEQGRLMQKLTLSLLHKVCRQCKPLVQQNPGLRISMNVSTQELLEEGFVEELALILRQHEFSGEWLNLEITESLLETNEKNLIGPMKYCADLGIHFHLDDFGTGYSSLARLHTLPFTTLKIDRAFVSRLGFEGDSIVEAIVKMAHALSLKVVCEGVETQKQYQLVQALSADEVQGYLFARPMPAHELPAWLESFQAENLSV